jgi:hypothetical protein
LRLNLDEVNMTDDAAKTPQDLEQEEFERNAVDPVPWAGQEPDPADQPNPGKAVDSSRHGDGDPGRPESDVPEPGSGAKSQR